MAQIDPEQQRALGVLTETVIAALGPGSIVSREVNRAYRSGRDADLRTASAAFNALPGGQRSRIGVDANRRARRLRERLLSGTGRDWKTLPGAGDERLIVPSPPRFLRPRGDR